jgi:very-short-patch-repair endonuclease
MPTKDPNQEDRDADENRGPSKKQKQDATAEAIVTLKNALIEESKSDRQDSGREATVEKRIEIATLIFVIFTTAGIFWQAAILNESDHAIQKSAIAAKDAADAAKDAVKLSPLMKEIVSLREWLEVARRRSFLRSSGTDALISAFDDAGLSPDRLPDTFNALAFHYRAMRVRQSRPVLRNMKGIDLENERARFVTVDNALKKRQREAVRLRLLRTTIPVGSGIGPKRDWTDLQCLRNEFTKQARHLPIRPLLSRSGRATQAMKPCFMMSPLSLAKFLPSRIMSFDLLIIDEASQMKPEDSLGGLLRAKKVVVVGDPNQLPPSDFFSRVTPADEGGAENEDESDDIDAESILDWSLKTFHAPRRLEWHYRSRCESLIAFSNREFYSSKSGSHGDLVTFPNAQPDSFSIDLVRVNGNYKASRNPAEVARVVEAAIDFMIQHADLPAHEIPTLGIVAINIEQRDAIREEFNRSGRDEAIERYLNACNKGTSKRGPEPFFIKNLENVQGDERDFVMISLTYGREVGQERVAQRFGPIARGQGHRRLNVLFTRARQRVVIFSSMGSDDVLVTPTTKRGIRVLRDYLRYVESRRLEVGIATGRDFDSDFERDVRSRLQARGFVVDPQVGVSGYRIDLGVRHPHHPAVYLAGVECDGAAFHSAKSARDRDRLRESVLRGTGWAILRVWSTDWFANAEIQTDRLASELQRLVSSPVQSRSPWTIVSQGTEAPTVIARSLGPRDEGPLVTDALEDRLQPSMPPQPFENVRLNETEVKIKLRAFRDSEIIRDFPQFVWMAARIRAKMAPSPGRGDLTSQAGSRLRVTGGV